MGFNDRSSVFAVGAAEGNAVSHLTPAAVAKLPSGDFPGKTVGQIAGRKRQKANYQGIKSAVAGGEIQPATVKNGVLVDGHTRAAAHLSLRKSMPVRASSA